MLLGIKSLTFKVDQAKHYSNAMANLEESLLQPVP